MNDARLRHDHDKPVALALMCSHDDLQRRRIEKGAASEVDHQEPFGAQVGFSGLDGGFKILGVSDIELAENVQSNDRVKILAYKSRAMV